MAEQGVAFEAAGGDKEAPLSPLLQAVADLEARGGSVDEYVPVIAEEMVTAVLDNFENERGHKQGPFPPLSPYTLARRRAKGKGAKMLQDTGIMKGSILPHAEGNVAEAYSNNPYIRYHTSPEPRRIIPLRDVFDIDMDAIRDYATAIILDGIVEGGLVPAS